MLLFLTRPFVSSKAADKVKKVCEYRINVNFIDMASIVRSRLTNEASIAISPCKAPCKALESETGMIFVSPTLKPQSSQQSIGPCSQVDNITAIGEATRGEVDMKHLGNSFLSFLQTGAVHHVANEQVQQQQR